MNPPSPLSITHAHLQKHAYSAEVEPQHSEVADVRVVTKGVDEEIIKTLVWADGVVNKVMDMTSEEAEGEVVGGLDGKTMINPNETVILPST